jgi:hypothetical protein
MKDKNIILAIIIFYLVSTNFIIYFVISSNGDFDDDNDESKDEEKNNNWWCGGTIYDNENKKRIYEINVIRNFSNPMEEQAIIVAENINYSYLFNLRIFEGYEVEYLDKNVIDYHTDTVNTAKETGELVNMNYTYYSNVLNYTNLTLEIINEDFETNIYANNQNMVENLTNNFNFYNTSVQISIVIFEDDGWYQHRWDEKSPPLITNFSDVFLVEMFFSDNRYVVPPKTANETNPVVRSSSPINKDYSPKIQYVLMDHNFNVKMIIISTPTITVSQQ